MFKAFGSCFGYLSIKVEYHFIYSEFSLHVSWSLPVLNCYLKEKICLLLDVIVQSFMVDYFWFPTSFFTYAWINNDKLLVYMIVGVNHLGGLPGLPGRVTLSARVAFCHVNDSRWGNPPSGGRVYVTFASAPKRAKSDSKKSQHWNVAARVDNERKRTLTAKMRRSPAIFSAYMPSDHATTSSIVTPGPRGCKFAEFACKRGSFLGGLPHLPGVPHLHVNRP